MCTKVYKIHVICKAFNNSFCSIFLSIHLRGKVFEGGKKEEEEDEEIGRFQRVPSWLSGFSLILPSKEVSKGRKFQRRRRRRRMSSVGYLWMPGDISYCNTYSCLHIKDGSREASPPSTVPLST